MVYGRSIAIGGCFLSAVVALSLLVFYLSLGSCPHGTFVCDDGRKCVPQRQICNNHTDCEDGSDEHLVDCGLLYGSKELTDKIVGIAIERRKERLEKGMVQQRQGAASTGGGANTTAESGPITTTPEPCDITTYPKECACALLSILYCGRKAKLTRIPIISDEVTNLMFNRNKLALRENAFANLSQLQRLTFRNTNVTRLPAGVFAGLTRLERLDMRRNNISQLEVGAFRGLSALQWLFLGGNQLRRFPLAHLVDMPRLEWLVLSDNSLTLRDEKFSRMNFLYEIYLDFNRIEFVGEATFAHLDNLHLLALNDNRITHLHAHAFWGLRNVRDIRLYGNPIKVLPSETFLHSNYLEALSIGHTSLHIGGALVQSLNVSFLNLTGIRFERIEFAALAAMPSLKYVIFDRFYFCSMMPHVRMCKPNTDGVSSFRDLLSKPVLRYSTWTMAAVTIGGNVMVLWGRFIYRDENAAVTMVIRNLALADILMGFYLLTIIALDFRYRDEYHKVALDWITSWKCAAVGALAVTSAEVSMLILAFMSLERFLLIADPFRGGHHRISIRKIFVALVGIWVAGVGIAVAPVILWRSSTKFYGSYSGTCFPLHIQEAYPLGWQYSAFMFLGVNLSLLLMIAVLYTALLISIWRTRSATPLSLLDCEFAVRFFFIVLTDMLCWAPIITTKIWVFYNYNISDEIYAWLVVFILPLNSAVNPLLYTFTTPKYRNQVLLRGWQKITARRRADPSNGLNTGTATGSSNPEESSGKAIPLMVNH